MNTKEKIIHAAIEVFFSKGFDGASMREIAAIAGVTKPVIYYYFKDKETLYLKLLEDHLDAFCTELEHILARNEEYQQLFLSVISLYETTFSKGAKIYHIIQREISGNGRFVGMLTKKYFSRIFTQLTTLMQKGIRHSVVRPIHDSHLAGLSFSAILLFYYSQSVVLKHLSRYVPPGTFSVYSLREHIMDLFLNR
ncbi:MAG: TetR/AcrR family transcriptional regulator [Desulfobacterota bacterium]|nr:TetR/AcrR family transcriptional regulator [Thermodesulfobacteriota bacterium]